MDITQTLIAKAKQNKKTIVFPEADFSQRVITACNQIAKEDLANVVVIGNQQSLQAKIDKQNLDKIKIVDIELFADLEKFANAFYEKRKSKGVTLEQARQMVKDPIYFANMYVDFGLADGIVCGAEVSTAQTLKPALQIIKGKQGLVSSYFLFVGENKVTDNAFLMGDCAVVENPTAQQLSLIGEYMLEEYTKLGLHDAKLAFLSYSTNGSSVGESSQKVKNAYEMFKANNKEVDAVGEVQFDASILPNVAKTKMPNHPFAKPANIFVMPNIDAGNICYKMVQYFGGLQAIGPITMGFNKPVNDLSRGCTVEDIILVTAITALQCE